MGGQSVIVVDTHALIWWVDDASRLSRKARQALRVHARRRELIVPAITVFEIVTLERRGRPAVQRTAAGMPGGHCEPPQDGRFPGAPPCVLHAGGRVLRRRGRQVYIPHGRALSWTYRQDSTFIYYCMALSIKDPEADRLAREVAKATGESLTTAVVQSLRERLARVRRMRGPRLSEELLKIGRRCARLAVKDKRSADEIIGYDEHGLPR